VDAREARVGPWPWRRLLLLAGAAGLVLGAGVEFEPVAWLADAKVPGAIFGASFGWVGWRYRPLTRTRSRGLRRWRDVVLLALVLPSLVAFMAWATLARALPWAWTRAFGVPATWPVHGSVLHSPNRHCDDRLLIADPVALRSVCVPASWHRGASGEPVAAELVGRRGALGFAVTGVQPLAPPDDRRRVP